MIHQGVLSVVPDWLTPGRGSGLLWIAGLCGVLAVFYIYLNRPSLADAKLRGETDAASRFPNELKTQTWFLRLCLLPLGLMAVCATTYYAWMQAPPSRSSLDLLWPDFLAFGVALNVAGLAGSYLLRRDWKLFHAIVEAVIAVGSGSLGGLLLWLVADKIFDSPFASQGWTASYVIFAFPSFLGVFLLAATLFLGAASRFTSDADREWMARAGAWVLIISLGWIATSSIAAYGPLLLVYGLKRTLSVGTLTGLVTLGLGHSGKTSARKGSSLVSTDLILAVAAPLFSIFVLICLALGTSWLIVELDGGELQGLTSVNGLLRIFNESPEGWVFGLMMGFLLIGIAASLILNINKFSLHATYRDRLIRAYLGASRSERERKPNSFTGLDENDNIQMHELRTELFHPDNLKTAGLPLFVDTLRKAGSNPRTWWQGWRRPVTNDMPTFLWEHLSQPTKDLIQSKDLIVSREVGNDLTLAIIDDLNHTIQGAPFYRYETGHRETIARNVKALRELFPGAFKSSEIETGGQRREDELQPKREFIVELESIAATPWWKRVFQSATAQERVAWFVWQQLSPATKTLLTQEPRRSDEEALLAVRTDLRSIILEPQLYRLNDSTLVSSDQIETLRRNRAEIECAFPDVFKPAETRRPLQIVNVTLNLVGGSKLAWQDRQAESFTISALHSGSYRVGYRDSVVYGLNKRTRKAISLGTALAISGAAVSPNMGYYSSTFVTFLLSLFNLRLGWWLGNPGRAGSKMVSTYDTAGPKFAARPIIDETLGLTNDKHPYVYLSDGGHFENLGLYEMVLRRCKRIVISDGSADERFGFADLGGAIRAIRVDLGVAIVIERIFMMPRDEKKDANEFGRPNPKTHGRYCAMGRICYSRVDSNNDLPPEKCDGELIYIKSFLSGTEPVDIFSYAKDHASFPHQSTADQFFSESQFESYRELGSHIVDKICKGLTSPSGLDDFFTHVSKTANDS